MRLPRARFGVRALLIAVGVAGLLVGGASLCRTAARRGATAASHRAREATLRATARSRLLEEEDATRELSSPLARLDSSSRPMDLREVLPQLRADRAALDARADWHARMAASYERAAARPWLPAGPGLPAPPLA